MLTKLSFFNSKKLAFNVFTLSTILMFSGTKAQTSAVVPDLTVASTFTGPFANSTRTYQMIIDDSQLTALSGKYLTSISFRIPSTAVASWPAANTTYPDYQIYLSDGKSS